MYMFLYIQDIGLCTSYFYYWNICKINIREDNKYYSLMLILINVVDIHDTSMHNYQLLI